MSVENGQLINGSNKKSMKRDPRFFRVKAKHHKVQVDDRFKSALKKKSKRENKAVDKYGRNKLANNDDPEDLRRYYNLSSSSDSESDSLGEENLNVDENDDSSESDESMENLKQQQQPEDNIKQPSTVPLGEATSRLALVNLDWDQIKARDIFVLVNGFKPSGGIVQCVYIYPSEFGKLRLQQEALHGPQISCIKSQDSNSSDIKDKNEKLDDDHVDDDADSDDKEEEEEQNLNRNIYEENLRLQAEERGYNEQELRLYQLDRLKYYFAIIECDSISTARHIYDQCDGHEFELSANVLDLRYIPDDLSFSDQECHDYCDAVPLPGSYRGKTDLITTALQNTRIKLTWDDDDIARRQVLMPMPNKKKKGKMDLGEDDLQVYLASASSDDDHQLHEEEKEQEGKESRAQRLKKLAQELQTEDGIKAQADVYGGRKQRKELGFEIAFRSAFDTQLDQENDDDDDKNNNSSSMDKEFSFEVKQPKKANKDKKKKLFDESSEGEEDNDTKLKNKKKSRKNKEVRPSRSGKNMIGGLLLPDSINKGDEKKSFEVDVHDERFAPSLYDNQDFGIDPSHKAFKPTSGMKAILKQRKLKYHQK